MGRATLHIFLWLLLALTPSTQELLRLHQNPRISAECNKHVTLNCDVASSREGLLIKRVEWSLNGTSLCTVDEKGEMITHAVHTIGGFHCKYTHGQLSLVLHRVQPRETNAKFKCKMHCKQGVGHMSTAVELQECCGEVQTALTDTASVCIFKHVHLGGDVHWFHGPRNITERFRNHTHTARHIDNKGWWTIISSLQRSSLYTPSRCLLMSTKSGRYLASALVRKAPDRNGCGVLTPASALLWILLTFTLLTIN